MVSGTHTSFCSISARYLLETHTHTHTHAHTHTQVANLGDSGLRILRGGKVIAATKPQVGRSVSSVKQWIGTAA